MAFPNLRDLARSIYGTLTPGVQVLVDKAKVTELLWGGVQKQLDALFARQAGVGIMVRRWVDLVALPAPSQDGQGATVAGPDGGTHTDPVVGGTVDNIGVYTWVAAAPGWRRISNYPNLGPAAVGLDQVDNTRDIDKPISDAVQAALNLKADAADVDAITAGALAEGVTAEWRPGVGTLPFVESAATAASEVTGAGWARTYVGLFTLASAARYPVGSGQAWQGDVELERLSNPTDAAGDSVILDLVWFNAAGTAIGASRIFPLIADAPFKVADGRPFLTFTIGAGMDYPPPVGAVTAQLRLRGFGPTTLPHGGKTAVSVFGVIRAHWAAAIAALQPTPIFAMGVTPAMPEMGQSVTPTVSWTLDGGRSYSAQAINGGAIAVAARSFSPGAPITADTTFELEVTDVAGNMFERSVTVDFRHRAFWGVSAAATLDEAGIEGLGSSGLVTAPVLDTTLNATGGRYVYFAYPTALGAAPPMSLYGFEVVPVQTVVAVTTAAGFAGNYRVLRSPELLTDAAVSLSIG